MKKKVAECYIFYETLKELLKNVTTFIQIMYILIFNKDINFILARDTFYNNDNFLREGRE